MKRDKGFTRRQMLGTSGVAVAAAMLHGPSVLAAPGADAGVLTHNEGGDPAPLPPGAFGPAIPEKGYLVEEISDGLYWVTEGSYQAIFMETRRGVWVVDAPPTLAAALPAAIAEVTSKPVTHFVYSHTHGDHVGVAGVLFPDATFIAQRETAATLLRRNDPVRRPVPTRIFDESFVLEQGSQKLELHYPGPNHEPGNIIMWAPKQETLMMVDVVFPGWVPFKSLALAQDVPGYESAHDAILGYPFETFVGGHLTRLGTRDDVETAKDFVADVRAASLDALATVDFFAVFGDIGFLDPNDPSFLNQWEAFQVYLDRVAHAAEEAVLDKWLGVLGAADIFTFSHCAEMVESIRIDDNAVAPPA